MLEHASVGKPQFSRVKHTGFTLRLRVLKSVHLVCRCWRHVPLYLADLLFVFSSFILKAIEADCKSVSSIYYWCFLVPEIFVKYIFDFFPKYQLLFKPNQTVALSQFLIVF